MTVCLRERTRVRLFLLSGSVFGVLGMPLEAPCTSEPCVAHSGFSGKLSRDSRPGKFLPGTAWSAR